MINDLHSPKKPFRILSIDGGGIRGILPISLLSEIEGHLIADGKQKAIWEHFDLITGTSTGGIIALALALGIPAKEVLEMYVSKAKTIFGNKKSILGRIFYSSHDRVDLEDIIRNLFSSYNKGKDPLVGDCKTDIAIPVYDLNRGQPKVIKSKYHPIFTRDYQIPAYMVALATAAAPTFFDPYSSCYADVTNKKVDFLNNIDGGVFANNPSLGCLIEVQQSFKVNLKDVKMLSIGTGHYRNLDNQQRSNYGLRYWIKKQRLTEVFLQAQAQEVENLISLLKNGIGRSEPDRFTYLRLDSELDEKTRVDLDEIRPEKLNKLASLGKGLWDKNSDSILKDFFS